MKNKIVTTYIMDQSNIFITQSEQNNNDISGKITYTSILESMPANKLEAPLKNWNKHYKTEWRWRFLKLSDTNMERFVVEISYTNSNERMYFNRFGEWVNRNIDKYYDQFVEKEYYAYTN